MNLSPEDQSKPAWVWKNILFFLVTTSIGVIGAPLYIARHGLQPFDLALFSFYIAATAMSITVGYHRLFAHCAFKAHPAVQFLVLFFGAAAFEQSAFRWASQHRDHHRYVDTDRDPYNIKKGFFYAHMGWLMFWTHPKRYDNAKDLQNNPLVMHQHRYYLLWAAGAGIILPVAIGALAGHALSAFILTVCLRLTLVYHSTFCINSVCHMFGKPAYDLNSTAKDHWFVAILTFGEGYHNFHHRFPSDYRNAVKWHQWDPSKWAIALLEKIGLAYDLKRVSYFRILDAEIMAQSQKARALLALKAGASHLQDVRVKLDEYYEEIKQRLAHWEQAVQHYRTVLSKQLDSSTSELRQAAAHQMQTAQKHFEASRKKWESLPLQRLGLAL